MISAEKIRGKIVDKKIKIAMQASEEQQKKNDRINLELLEVEKAINGFNAFASRSSLDLRIANSKYITVPILVSRDVMLILQKEGYYVKLDIHGRKTHLYFNNERWMGTLDVGDSIAVPCETTLGDNLGKQDKFKTTLDTNANSIKTELHNSKVEDECTVTKEESDCLTEKTILDYIKDTDSKWNIELLKELFPDIKIYRL